MCNTCTVCIVCTVCNVHTLCNFSIMCNTFTVCIVCTVCKVCTLCNFFPSNTFLRRRRKKALLRVNDQGVVGKRVY